MIATDEYLMFIWQVAKPVKEVNRLPIRANYTEIAGMLNNISLGQIPKPSVVNH